MEEYGWVETIRTICLKDHSVESTLKYMPSLEYQNVYVHQLSLLAFFESRKEGVVDLSRPLCRAYLRDIAAVIPIGYRSSTGNLPKLSTQEQPIRHCQLSCIADRRVPHHIHSLESLAWKYRLGADTLRLSQPKNHRYLTAYSRLILLGKHKMRLCVPSL